MSSDGRAIPIAISGIGLTTCQGASAEQTWRNILTGRPGMGAMSAMESPLPAGKDGGQASELPDDFEPTLPREVRYLRWTIRAALRDAALNEKLPYDPSRCQYVLGTTLHGMRAGGRFLRGNDPGELRTFLAGDTLRLATNGLGISGASATTCSACSSSLGAIALGVTLLQNYQSDLIVAGGYDTISEYVYGGFNALRLVAEGPLRPFTRGRSGMKLAEGYGIVVLERLDDARKRGATSHVVVAGWGESADSHHLTQPHPQGDGALRAMKAALDRAGIQPSQVDMIAAHATGTPDNDAAEHAALASLFGADLAKIPVAAFKSHLGHTLGGAGASELILSAMAIRDQIVPACANVDPEQIEFPDMNVTHGAPRRSPLRFTLNTSLGFGGANTSVVLSAPEANHAPPRAARPREEVWITGIGVAAPGMIGNEAFIARLRDVETPAWQRPLVPIDDTEFEHLLNARRVRRLSPYVKLTLCTATLATQNARLSDQTELLAAASAILGTTHGSASYSYDYYEQIVREGVMFANPLLFAEGVPNAAAAQLSLMLGLKGSCQAIIGTRTAGLDALRLAALRIAGGDSERILVSAGEETHFSLDRAYRQCGLQAADLGTAPFGCESGFCSRPAAVSLWLESATAAKARGARPYARIDAATAFDAGPGKTPRSLAQLLESMPDIDQLILSANATWIDRAELAAISRLNRPASIGAIYDYCGETFSAGPLLGIAATCLGGSMPSLLRPPAESPENVKWESQRDPVQHFGVLCTDWNGLAAAVQIERFERVAP